MVAGLSRAKRSYSASVALQASRVAEENLATATIPSGRSGRGLEASLTISSSCSYSLLSVSGVIKMCVGGQQNESCREREHCMVENDLPLDFFLF